MLSKKLHEALNAQINAELWSAYLYLSMSMDAEAKGLKGVANWFYIQFQEEQDHARIFMNYILSRDAEVTLRPIAEVRTSWASPLEMFRDTLEHEKKVTALINDLAAIAAEDKDYASSNMLVWFIDEQVEEEESARGMITACEAVEGNKFGMYMLDKELAFRFFGRRAGFFCCRALSGGGFFRAVLSVRFPLRPHSGSGHRFGAIVPGGSRYPPCGPGRAGVPGECGRGAPP